MRKDFLLVTMLKVRLQNWFHGAFVEVAEGVEGLIHVSELSWTKRITRPSDVLELVRMWKLLF